MRRPRVTYYFSTGSRYSYLSMSQVPALERKHGLRFDWVPVNGKRIRGLRGADPFQVAPQSGQYDWGYRERDAAAWADYYDIPFVEPKDVEFDVELLLRGVIAAGQQGDMREYAWQLAQEVFARGTWPLDEAVVLRVANVCDLDEAQFMADLNVPETQQILEANCAQAVSEGAFGTPSLFLDETLYWGNDRLVLLDHALGKHNTSKQQAASRTTATKTPFTKLKVAAIDHVVLRTCDPKNLVGFYESLLETQVERIVGDFLWQMRIGDCLLDILRADSDPPIHHNVDHVCLRVVDIDWEVTLAWLSDQGCSVEESGKIYGAQGFGRSIYFVDPQGNKIELKEAQWQ